MMSLDEAIRERHSVRAYEDKPVEGKELDEPTRLIVDQFTWE